MSQADLLYDLLKDGRPHRTDEIARVIYALRGPGRERAGARVADLKIGKHAAKIRCDIIGWTDKDNRTLYWYQFLFPPTPPPKSPEPPRKVEAPERKQATLV